MNKKKKARSFIWACLCLSLGCLGSSVFHNWAYMDAGVIIWLLIFILS